MTLFIVWVFFAIKLLLKLFNVEVLRILGFLDLISLMLKIFMAHQLLIN